MKRWMAGLCLTGLVVAASGGEGSDPVWHSWKTGTMMEIRIGPWVYRDARDQIRVPVAVLNRASRPIYLDPTSGLSINQWTSGDQPHRVVVDERRLAARPMSLAEGVALARRATSLGPPIEVGKERQLWAFFTGSAGASEIDKRQEKFLILVLDGAIRCTDGSRSECLMRREDEFSETDVGYPLPIQWRR